MTSVVQRWIECDLTRQFNLIMGLIIVATTTSAQLFDGALGELQEQRAATPGSEITIELPETGGFCLVYVPTDYDPQRPAPLIFCYHGTGGVPTTWPLRHATKGERYLVVGIGYAAGPRANPQDETLVQAELAQFEEAYRIVVSRYSVDEDAVFMGGFSKGGYWTTILGERLLTRLKGLLILGAGRAFVDWNKPNARDIRDKPIFFGVGDEDDPHYERDRNAAEVYRRWGAEVTFDVWEGYGHRWDSRAPHEIDVWLRKHAFPTDGSAP